MLLLWSISVNLWDWWIIGINLLTHLLILVTDTLLTMLSTDLLTTNKVKLGTNLNTRRSSYTMLLEFSLDTLWLQVLELSTEWNWLVRTTEL